MTTAARPATTGVSAPTRPWTVGWLLEACLAVLAAALLGLLLSILVEWLGMTFWWPEQGAFHSARLLEQELALLNDEFRASVLGSHPALLAERAAMWTYRYSGLEWLLA